MRIEIDAYARRGLKFIDLIPNIRLCRIEGYNGIGKTNAIRLLSLCTGGQPFRSDTRAWSTFRDQLDTARILVTELNGAESIEWQISSSDLPARPEPLLDGARLLKIDGKSASVGDAHALLSVHHLIATETPLEALASEVAFTKLLIQRWLRNDGGDRQQRADLALSAAQRVILDASPSQLSAEINAAEEAQRQVDAIEPRLRELETRVELLEEAAKLSGQLEQVRDRGPELDALIEQSSSEWEQLLEEQRRLDDSITETAQRQHLDENANREFDLARRFLETKEGALSDATSRLERLRAAARLDADKDVDVELKRQSARLQELVARLPQVNATPLLRALVEELLTALVAAQEKELGDSIVVSFTSPDLQVSIAELRLALKHKLSELSALKPSAEAQALAEMIAVLRERIRALSETTRAVQNVQAARADVDRAQRRMRAATLAIQESGGANLEGLVEERNEVDARGRLVLSTLERLREAKALLGGGRTEDELAARLNDLCRRAGVSPSRLKGQLDRLRAEVDSTVREHVTAQQAQKRAENAVKARVSAVTEACAALAAEDQYQWLVTSQEPLADWGQQTVVQQAALLHAAFLSIEKARNELSLNMASVQGIAGALERLEKLLRTQQVADDDSPDLWDVTTRRWLATRINTWFADPQVSKALFDGATSIELSPETLSVSWSVDGVEYSRPLSGFSSGQQAFAYTMAQLTSLEQAPGAQNRLIALDEFGALLDEARRRELADYLTNRSSRASSDQILVILPLESVSTEIDETDASARERLRQLQDKGYIAEEFKR